MNKPQLRKRFDATKVANYNESLRLEGLKPTDKTRQQLHPKLAAKLKELQSSDD
ncbi:YhfG family protein [Rheinheimera soli]|jgi:hypothetical protein|uniref:DUF2559 family protein n=1 Tax=Rheinheimera soli TaxID=443616 RepID=A0ABU1VTN5_9GAMM|nr:YhfG family protein [Rheinheimera soli]MDR7119086.1 hypothetical protein [Rheinheimera soli]